MATDSMTILSVTERIKEIIYVAGDLVTCSQMTLPRTGLMKGSIILWALQLRHLRTRVESVYGGHDFVVRVTWDGDTNIHGINPRVVTH